MKRLIFLLIGLNVLLVSVLNSNHPINSDTVWSYLLLPNFLKNMVYLGPDTFLLHYPISYLLVKLAGLGITTAYLDTLFLVFSTIAGWLVFYFYFLKKHLRQIKFIYILPAFLFINFSLNFYLTIGIPSLRNVEFAVALLLSIYFDRYLLHRGNKLLKGFVFLTMLLLFISDPYFIYVFAIPLLFILLFKSRSDSKYWGASGLLSITIFANTALRFLLNKTQLFTLSTVSNARIVSPHKIISNIDLTVKGILKILDSFPNFNILSILSISLFLIGIYGLWVMLKNGLKNKQIALQLLPFCFIFTFLAYLASGQPTDLETFRYLIFVVFIIPFGICYAISRFSSKSARILITFGIIILSTTNIIRMNSGFKSRNNSQLYENNLLIIETINEQGLNHGYTSYWNAGINTFLSKNTIQFTQVACVNHKILPFKWLASQKWFEPQNYLGKTFLMIDHVGNLTPELKTCNLEDIANQFGEPSRTMPVTVEGGTFSLIIFDYNIAERLY